MNQKTLKCIKNCLEASKISNTKIASTLNTTIDNLDDTLNNLSIDQAIELAKLCDVSLDVLIEGNTKKVIRNKKIIKTIIYSVILAAVAITYPIMVMMVDMLDTWYLFFFFVLLWGFGVVYSIIQIIKTNVVKK